MEILSWEGISNNHKFTPNYIALRHCNAYKQNSPFSCPTKDMCILVTLSITDYSTRNFWRKKLLSFTDHRSDNLNINCINCNFCAVYSQCYLAPWTLVLIAQIRSLWVIYIKALMLLRCWDEEHSWAFRRTPLWPSVISCPVSMLCHYLSVSDCS